MFSVINRLCLFFLVFPLFGNLVFCQIQQEYLPQTQTLLEIRLRLDVIEDNLMTIPLDAGHDQLMSIRRQCDALIDFLQPAEKQEATQLTHRALLLEAVLNYSHGERTEGEKLANELLRQNPSILLSGKIATSDIAEWFEDVRENHIGFIHVISIPSGCSVYLDGIELGLTPLENAFAPVGIQTLEITRSGYESVTQQITIEHQETSVVDVRLKRNSGNLLVWVSPPGTSISVDSPEKSVVSVPAPSCYYPLLLNLGFNPVTFSAPMLITGLPAGERVVSFQRDCRQFIQYKMQIEPADYFLPLLILPESTTEITVRSEPAGRSVFVDGARVGVTPLQRLKVCPGERTIRVEFDQNSEWSQTVMLEPDKEIVFNTFPRLSMLFLGCGSSDRGLAAEGDYVIRNWLESSDAFNVLNPDFVRRQRLRPSVASVFETLNIGIFNIDDPNWHARVENMITTLSDTPASVFAFARLSPATSQKPGFLFLMHPKSSRPDVIHLPPGLPNAFLDQIMTGLLQTIPPMTRLKSGVRITERNQNVYISQIIPEGPAEISPLQTGDRIVTMNGKTVNGKHGFEAILTDPKSPEKMPVSVIRETRQIDTEIEMKRQPVIASLNDDRIPYNLIFAKLDMMMTEPGSPPDYVLINAGVCCLAMQRPDIALQYFEKCRFSDSDGIGSGTLAYLMYRAEDALNNKPLADIQFRKVMESPKATIIHGDGPWLRDLVK